jgi:ribonuclease BN (tRNA processing enzyme)
VPAPRGGVRLRFLGSGDAFGSGGRLQTCLLLEGASAPVLIDCGASSLVALKRAGIDPNDVDTVIVTHLHGDHFGGLPFFVLDGQFSRRTRPLVVAGPPGIAARVQQAMEVFFPGSSTAPRKFPLEFAELEERRATEVGAATVTSFLVEHACGAPPFAVRVGYGGRTVAYSGDTEWTEALLDAARGADLFVCEAYFFDKRIRYHLDFATLRAQRGRLGCRRLILTHLGADMLSRLAEVDAECATDGLVVDL